MVPLLTMDAVQLNPRRSSNASCPALLDGGQRDSMLAIVALTAATEMEPH